MNCFEILGIDPTTEVRAIRKAYAAKSRQFHPEEQPEEFKQLHDAYQMALAWARNPESGQGEFTPESPMAEELVQAEGGPAESGTEEELVDTEEEDQEGEPPLPEDWQESFSRIAGASMDNAGLAQAVRRIMGHCRALYGQEQEKGKLYRWRDIFEVQGYFPVFSTREFVEAWYTFLQSHHTFPLRVWQYFASLDGLRFSGEAAGLGRFPYGEYMEALTREEETAPEKKPPQTGMPEKEQPGTGAPEKQGTPEKQEKSPEPEYGSRSGGYGTWQEGRPGQGKPKPPAEAEKKRSPLWLRILLYVLLVAGCAILGTVTGLAAGLIF